MTNPCGLSFLSYRRSQHVAARLLIEAQHEFGIPTWQDVRDLESAPLETELRTRLRDPSTANAVWLMTPDVSDSPIIRTIEYPEAIERQRVGDAFFIKPLVTGGLDYNRAAALSGGVTVEDLTAWSLTHLDGDLTAPVAADVAASVLEHRLRRIHTSLAAKSSVRIGIYTRVAPDVDDERALTLDWTHRFTGRLADQIGWQQCTDAARRAIDLVRRRLPGRPVEIGGLASLPACVLMGSLFLQPIGVDVRWLQRTGGNTTAWSLTGPVDQTGFRITERPGRVTANDLAVLASVNRLVESTAAGVGLEFRAIVEVRLTDMNVPLAPEQGRAIANALINSARRARDEYRISGNIHLFLAVPAALAFMIGQLLNTFGHVHTYEYIAENHTYQPAVVLTPSS